MKFLPYEAEGVAGIAKDYWLFGWLYPLVGVAGASIVIGVLIALGGRFPRLGLLGALILKLREEAGLIIEGCPTLVSVHSNERFFRGDHVLVYRIDRFSLTDRTSHGEIADIGWFDPQALPEDTHRATRDRLGEVLGGEEAITAW